MHDPLIPDQFERVYRKFNLIGSPETTIRVFRIDIGVLCQYVALPSNVWLSPPRMSMLCDDLVAEVMHWLIEQGRAVGTANRFYRHITALWRDGFRRGLVDQYPRLKKIKAPVKIKRTWLTHEYTAMLSVAQRLPDVAAACNARNRTGKGLCPGVGTLGSPCTMSQCQGVYRRRFPSMVCGIPSSDWWFSLLLSDYYTGLRVTPLMLVETPGLDLSRGELMVQAGTQKQNRDQIFELPADMIKSLLTIQPQGRRFIFPWPLDRSIKTGQYNHNWKSLRRWLRRIIVAAGLPDTSDRLFHCIRRKTATDAKAAGGIEAARQLLDHSHQSVTWGYVDPMQSPERIRPAQLLQSPVPPPPDGPLRIVG